MSDDTKAPKKDDGKPPLNLLAPQFLVAVAEVLAFGAKKYASWSWTKGKEWGRDYAAAQRHLNAWWDGQDLDPETGLSHLAHAACDIMFLLVSQARGLGTDDRPWTVKVTQEIRADDADRVVNKTRETIEKAIKVQLPPPPPASDAGVDVSDFKYEAWLAGGCLVCGARERGGMRYFHGDCATPVNVVALYQAMLKADELLALGDE